MARRWKLWVIGTAVAATSILLVWWAAGKVLCQGLNGEAANQLVVVVRPSESLGVSLWGSAGDAEMVEVIFCVSTETSRVSVSNQCT